MSRRPSPLVSARKRGWRSTRQPPAVVAEVAQDELGGLVAAAGQCSREPDAVVAEADDVGPPVAAGVGEEAGVAVDSPAAGGVAEVPHDQLGRIEATLCLRSREPNAVIAEADDVAAAVAARIGGEAGMPVHAPARVRPEVGDRELGRPAEVAGRVRAERPGVASHQAIDTAAHGAVLAVQVRQPVAAPAAAAIAVAARVLVRRPEDVAGLMGEDAVDVVRAPAVVVVLHDEPRSADEGVGEMGERILREEGAVGPAGREPGSQVLDVRLHSAPVRAEPERRHRRVPPERLEVGGLRVGRDVELDVADLEGERDVRERVGLDEEAEAVLHLGDHLGPLRLRELQPAVGTLHDHDAHGHASLEVGAGRPRGGDRSRRRRRRRRGLDGGAVGHLPGLAIPRPAELGVPVLVRLAELQGGKAEALGLVELVGLDCLAGRERDAPGDRGCDDREPPEAMQHTARRARLVGAAGRLEHWQFGEAQIACHLVRRHRFSSARALSRRRTPPGSIWPCPRAQRRWSSSGRAPSSTPSAGRSRCASSSRRGSRSWPRARRTCGPSRGGPKCSPCTPATSRLRSLRGLTSRPACSRRPGTSGSGRRPARARARPGTHPTASRRDVL